MTSAISCAVQIRFTRPRSAAFRFAFGHDRVQAVYRLEADAALRRRVVPLGARRSAKQDGLPAWAEADLLMTAVIRAEERSPPNP